MGKDKRYFAGIDIGTTNIKGALYCADGKLIANSILDYPSYTPEKNRHEQDPQDWVSGFIEVLGQLCEKGSVTSGLESLSLSTQGGTAVVVDKDYEPLYPAMTWLDRRGDKILDTDSKLADKDTWFYQKTGWRLGCNMSFMPIYWLKVNRPDIFIKIHKVLFVNDYVLKKITGNNVQDPSNASITLFYNVADGRWDDEILEIMGLEQKDFSDTYRSGKLVGYLDEGICRRVGITTKVKVINGGHDQYCASIGAGIFSDREMMIATGTAWVFFKLLEKPLFDNKRLFAIGRNIIEGKFGLIYSIPCAGASLRWYASNILGIEESELIAIIDKNSQDILKNKNSILFYPYLTGNFGPDSDIGKKASILNLELGHDRMDILKAIMEGVAFQLNRILEVLAEKNINGDRIKMVGGAAKSTIWPRILSDITGMDIMLPNDTDVDLTTRGAAILAGLGAGIFSTIEHGFDVLDTGFRVVKPSKMLDFYRDKYREFTKRYQ